MYGIYSHGTATPAHPTAEAAPATIAAEDHSPLEPPPRHELPIPPMEMEMATMRRTSSALGALDHSANGAAASPLAADVVGSTQTLTPGVAMHPLPGRGVKSMFAALDLIHAAGRSCRGRAFVQRPRGASLISRLVKFAPVRRVCTQRRSRWRGVRPQPYRRCHPRGSRSATVRVREGGWAVRPMGSTDILTRDARGRIAQLAMERKSLLDPTNSSDGQFEEINLEEGAADGSKALRPPASKVDLESLRRTPVWNVVVNSVTYMASASHNPPLVPLHPPALPAARRERAHCSSCTPRCIPIAQPGGLTHALAAVAGLTTPTDPPVAAVVG
jgi:hypothetical protein